MNRYESILGRIKNAQTHPHTKPITLIAVSKTQTADAVHKLYQLGQRDFGENYAQELVEKAEELKKRGCDSIRWHFIGHLQSNKVKLILPYVSCIHTIDSEKLANEINKHWVKSKRQGQLDVFLEINIDKEITKSGFMPENVFSLASRLSQYPAIKILGLMCIPNPAHSLTGDSFRKLKFLEETCRPFTQGFLSMGMSQDFELALHEGATHVRIGTALFGERPKKS